MQKIVIGICDDQYTVLKQLEKIISEYLFKVERDSDIILFQNGMDAVDQSKRLDVLFLDIEMPSMDGIEVGKYLRQKNSKCKIIMATGKLERFKEVFKINAFRFVSKPFINEEIENALEDALKAIIGTETIKFYDNRISYEIPLRDICYIYAYDSYCEAITKNQKLRKDISLTKLEEKLDEKIFFRLNRTYLINFMYVEDYKNGEVLVADSRLRIPRLKKKEFEKKFKEYDIYYR